MGRIVTSVTVRNVLDAEKSMRMDALVDTGATYLVLPVAWKDRLGDFESEREVELQTAEQKVTRGTLCGPARIQVEGFSHIYNEVLFLDMDPVSSAYIYHVYEAREGARGGEGTAGGGCGCN